jgi:2-methylfumaryl-CoA isomerase
MMSSGVLSGLRIIELSAFISVPLGGATLASLGAEVIRIEQIGGGPDAERWPVHNGKSLYRAGLDEGKRSVEVDLRSEEGRALVIDLATAPGEDAGILVTNLPVDGWLSYEQLISRRPDMIFLVVTGSSDGRAAVDYTVNAGIGFPLVTGSEESTAPVNHVLPAWDVAAGLYSSTAILAAERHRRLTGNGQLVKLALSDVALAVANHLGYVAEALLVDAPRERTGNAIYGSYGRDFCSSDGHLVMICAMTRRQWQSLGEATELEASFAALERRLDSNLDLDRERFRYRHDIDGLLEPWVATRSLVEIKERFDAAQVLWSPYRTFKELVAEDPHARSPFGTPLRFSTFAHTAPLPPSIGADTERTLHEVLGLDERTVAMLKGNGTIG